MMVRILASGAVLLLAACNVIKSDLLGDGGGSHDGPSDGTSDMPEPGLILRYTFEDTATAVRDVSGRHMDGTASATTVWIADGRTGRGLGLGGTQYVSLPSGVLTGVDDFTIAAWVKLSSASDWQRIYDFGNVAGDRFMYLTISGYEPMAAPDGSAIYDGVHVSSFGGSVENENWLGSKTRLPTLVWKHLAITGSGGDRHLYIDGFPVATRVGGGKGGTNVPPREMEPMAPNSWLGKSRFGDPGLNGALDEFRIYNRVLTASELAELAWPQHDYSYWRFNEGSGTSAKDSSDNAITATLTSDVTWTTGRLGGAIKLSGGPPGPTGPHATLASNPLARCTEFTVATWIKLSALDGRIFDFGTGSDTYVYLAVTDGTGMHFGMAVPGKPAFDLATPSPLAADDTWHHVAVTLLSGVARIYVDGEQAATQGGTSIRPGDLGATTENWLGQSRAGDRYLSGSLDELRIACRAYTGDEIKNLARP